MSKPTRNRPEAINGAKWRKLKARVLREEDRCHHCGVPVSARTPPGHDNSPEVDHLLPVTELPDLMFTRSNVVLSCRKCNRRKGTSATAEVGPPQEGPSCAYYWSMDFYGLEDKAAAGTLTDADAEYLAWFKRGQEARALKARAGATSNTRRGPAARSRRP
jgi:hypothetical protein